MVDLGTLSGGVNAVWMLTVSFLVFFMQPGFALLEAGQVRAKNVANVLMKNMVDWGTGVLVYFSVGLGVAGLAGGLTSPGAVSIAGAFSYLGDPNAWLGWLLGAVFAMTAATVVSGAVAERMKFEAYVVYSVCLTAVVYPVVQGIVWDGGLLSANGFLGSALGVGYLDFAGATVVHMLGGVAGLVGAWMVGPRRGRFDDDGNRHPIPGHSITFVVLGTFVMAFGWYGFNVGAQAAVLSVEDGGLAYAGETLGRVALNTTLAMGAGLVAAALTTNYTEGNPDPLFTANGMLAGLAAITGAAPYVTWYGGVVLGVVAGVQTPLVYHWVVDSLRIDDVCGVFAVNGSAAAIGTWLLPLFAVGGVSATQLAMQTVGIAVIALWTAGATWVVFTGIDRTIGLRVDEADEERGLDRSEHGYTAYPEFIEGAAGQAGTGVAGPGNEPRTPATDGGEPRSDD
jgi:Amt family ammonium transporter